MHPFTDRWNHSSELHPRVIVVVGLAADRDAGGLRPLSPQRGVTLLAYLLFRLSGHAGRSLLPTIAVAAFVLVFIGEFIGRMLFYASMVRVGI